MTESRTCPRCNGRTYIELDKVGLLTCNCPECDGTGKVYKLTSEEMFDGLESEGSKGNALMVGNLEKAVEQIESHVKSCPECEKEEELYAKRINSGAGQSLGTTGSPDTGKPKQPKKRKAKKRSRKKSG